MIAANPALQERELLKMAEPGRRRDRGPARAGRPRPRAPPLAAQAGVTAFSLGFELWVADASSADLATRIRETLDQLRAVSVGDPPSVAA